MSVIKFLGRDIDREMYVHVNNLYSSVFVIADRKSVV